MQKVCKSVQCIKIVHLCQISVYEDRLYVANVDSLSENWTIESLMAKHSSVPYNPNIASVFYLAGFIESWGRGVEKICDALKADNLPMPEYTVHPGDIMIKFTGPEDRIVRVTDKVIDKVTDKVTEGIDYCRGNGIKILTQLTTF